MRERERQSFTEEVEGGGERKRDTERNEFEKQNA